MDLTQASPKLVTKKQHDAHFNRDLHHSNDLKINNFLKMNSRAHKAQPNKKRIISFGPMSPREYALQNRVISNFITYLAKKSRQERKK